MKPSMLQMVMVVLATAAFGSGVDKNLREVWEQISLLNHSIPQDHFVENLFSEDVFRNCGNAFFCKAKEVVLQTNLSKLVLSENLQAYTTAEDKFKRNMDQFLKHQKANCTVILKNIKPLNNSKQIRGFWDDIIKCIRRHNWNKQK